MFLAVLGRLFSRKLTGVEGRGLFGFEKSIKLETQVGSNKFAIGVLAYGGEHQRGRWMFQITGVGCSVVPDWHRFSKFFRRIGARITRLDLAVDYLDGAYTVDDAVAMYQSGAFTTNGRPPSSHVAGDWLNKVMGRTLYIGKSTNGKMLRVYEKGIQLGELNSPWVRFEVQLGNRDRVIPFDAMTRRDAFLAGCYPALQTMLGCASEAISTSRKEGALLVSHLMFHLKRSYGKLLSVVSSVFTPDSSDLIDCLTVIGTPRRMTPAVESPGITFEQILRDMDAVTA
jgi:phage replication initiation protein